MTRHKRAEWVRTHYEPGAFVTIVCAAASHDGWGLRTFTRSGSVWIPSQNLQLLGGESWTADSAGPQLRARGNDDGVQRLSADHEPLPEIDPDDYDWQNPEHRENAERRDAPGAYDRITLRCGRCGDNLPVTWPKLAAALDMLTAALPDRSFYRLTELRRAIDAASRG